VQNTFAGLEDEFAQASIRLSMKPPFTSVLLCLLLAGCQSQAAVAPASQEIVIRSGTSFGMCLGYCITEMRIDARQVRFTRSARDASLPEQTRTLPMTPERWTALRGDIDWSAIAAMEDVYGCPDCADGGAEWVEVSTSTTEKRITLEHGATVPELQPLLEQIRALRDSLQAEP
jgi:hypothetical protein